MANGADQENCIFCKIIDRKMASKIVSEDDCYLAIRDINPQAPVHILVMPKTHVPSVAEFEDSLQLGELFQAACAVAKNEQLSSFRLVVNTGEQAGQTVYHLHIHVLGGRSMHWPPG